MWWFEVEDIEDSLDQVIIILAEEFSDHFVVVLKDLFEGKMHGIFLQLNRMVYDDLQPLLANIEFCYGVVFDDLPDQVVGPIEDRLQGLVFSLKGFVDLLQDLLADLPDDGEQFRADLEIHAYVLQLLVG